MAGLSWWSSQAPLYGENVTFTIRTYSSSDSVTHQGYEPILHSSSNDALWISAIMSKLGFFSGNILSRVDAFNTWLKNDCGANWAYSVFIGYNPYSAKSTFTNGYFPMPIWEVLIPSCCSGTTAGERRVSDSFWLTKPVIFSGHAMSITKQDMEGAPRTGLVEGLVTISRTETASIAIQMQWSV
jgi:hypothetical protein